MRDLAIFNGEIDADERRGENNTPKIFISYSHEDNDFAEKLVVDLQNYCLSIWIDRLEMRPGDSLWEKISRGMKKSDYLAVILSPDSVKSNWVKKEVKIALGKESKVKRFKVIPVILRECKIASYLEGKIWADFRQSYSNGFAELLRGICRDKEIITYKIDRNLFAPDFKAIEQATSLGNSVPPKDFLFVYEDNDFLNELDKIWWTDDELDSIIKADAIRQVFKVDISGNKRAIPLLIENYKLILPKYIQIAVNYLGRHVTVCDLVAESVGMLTKKMFFSISMKMQHYGDKERIKAMNSVNGENLLSEIEKAKSIETSGSGLEAYIYGCNPENMLYLGFGGKGSHEENTIFDVTVRVPSEAISHSTKQSLDMRMYPLLPDLEIFSINWVKYFMPEIAFHHILNASYTSQVITRNVHRVGLKKSDYFHFGYE